MIHYTLLDPEVIWSDLNQKPFPLEKYSVDGKLLLMRKINEQTWMVEQLLSTDPMDYMLPQCQPGVLYGLKPQILTDITPA